METVLESDREEQARGGETQEEEEEEEEEEGALSDSPVSAPQLLLSLDKADDLCPESYRVNSPSEIRLLAIADSFQHQYSHMFPDRKPLLLCPVNECGVKKFVSVTLQPTPPVHPELSTWEGCASFVANFLSLEPLEPPVDLPRYLFSPTLVLQSQKGTCFEFATLLCSLLIGADYDAYCVSGYAVREMCLLDQSLQECPLLYTEVKTQISEEQEPKENKYTVKSLKELRSDFVIQQEKKKQAVNLQTQKLEEQKIEWQSDETLRGLRLHCWVLILSGSHSVQHNFFIDPLTGHSYPTTDDNFLGIESVWNNLNYYVNMQDCRSGCADMVFDLEDSNMWEPVLFDAMKNKQLTRNTLQKKEIKTMSKHNIDEEEEEKPLDFAMPRSWVSNIIISKEDWETRWPQGMKVTLYRKAKLEEFQANLRSDGLVTQLTMYKDLDCTQVVLVKGWFKHRNDHLEEREINKVDNFTAERFKRGRRFHLLCKYFTYHQKKLKSTENK